MAPALGSSPTEKKNGIELAWVVPEEGAKFDTDGLWIPKGLPENELHWAKQYVDFAMSQAAQSSTVLATTRWTFVAEAARDGNSILRIIHYPPVPPGANPDTPLPVVSVSAQS